MPALLRRYLSFAGAALHFYVKVDRSTELAYTVAPAYGEPDADVLKAAWCVVFGVGLDRHGRLPQELRSASPDCPATTLTLRGK